MGDGGQLIVQDRTGVATYEHSWGFHLGQGGSLEKRLKVYDGNQRVLTLPNIGTVFNDLAFKIKMSEEAIDGNQTVKFVTFTMPGGDSFRRTIFPRDPQAKYYIVAGRKEGNPWHWHNCIITEVN